MSVLVFQGSIQINIQITKGVNVHNDIQKRIFKEILQKVSDNFLPYKNSFIAIKEKLQENLLLPLQQSINWTEFIMIVSLKRGK